MRTICKTFIVITLIPLVVLAIESVMPYTLCDRFITMDEQISCKKRLEKLETDSYLAGVCQKQFEDDSFWECMEMSNKMSFDPKVLEGCLIDGYSDKQRLDCVRVVGRFSKNPQPVYQASGKVDGLQKASRKEGPSQSIKPSALMPEKQSPKGSK